MEEHDKIALRSEEVQEILGTPPSSIVRWGTIAVLCSILLLGWLSWWIKYPNKIKVPIRLTTLSPPIKVIAKTDGYVAKLVHNESGDIQRGRPLAVIESQAEYKDILFLDSIIKITLPFTDADWLNTNLPVGLEIGRLQNDYALLINELERFKVKSRLSSKPINSNAKNRISRLKQQHLSTVKEVAIYKKELEILKNHFQELRAGYIQKTVSLAELKQGRKNIVDKENAILELNKTSKIILENIQVLQGVIQNTPSQPVVVNIDRLEESRDLVLSSIRDWKDMYLLPAPADGKVAFNTFSRDQQYFQRGEEVMSIVPPGNDSIIGLLYISTTNKDKLKPNQTISINLAAFSADKFGVIEGKIQDIGPVMKNDSHPVTISLPQGLKTSLNIEVAFSEGMEGMAEIITEKKRLYKKVLEDVSKQ